MLLLYGLLAAWLTASLGALGFAWLFLRRLGSAAPRETEPPVCVVAPVRGSSPLLAPFVRRLRSLDYGPYRIVAVVESEDDPAYRALLALSEEASGAPLTVAVAGLADDEGQKVHNIRRGLAELSSADEIVAFIDADTLPSSDWLTRLVRPLTREPDIAAVTGYRWITPSDGRLWSAVVASANCSVLTAPRPWSVCWGGTLALRRATVDAFDLRGRLAGAVVDDVHLTAILKKEGLRVFSPRSLVVLSPAGHDLASAFAFGRRQYQFVRLYLPATWATAATLLTLPLLGCAAGLGLAAVGDHVALAALLCAILIGQARASVRAAIARKLWAGEASDVYRRQAASDRLAAPAWAALHAACLWASLSARTIAWAGIVYEVEGRTRTRVLRRLIA